MWGCLTFWLFLLLLLLILWFVSFWYTFFLLDQDGEKYCYFFDSPAPVLCSFIALVYSELFLLVLLASSFYYLSFDTYFSQENPFSSRETQSSAGEFDLLLR